MSHQRRTLDRLRQLGRRLLGQIEQRGDMEAPGVVFRNDRTWIDSGQYGDPHADNTPDFVKRDDDGWVKL